MKKLTLLAAAAFIVASMSSCKKEYTCECCVDFLGTKTCGSAVIKDTKKNATSACTAKATSGVTCGIK